MGPHEGRRPAPLSEAGGWRDDVGAMNELVASHPTLTWHRPAYLGAPHAATWQDDEGAQRAERERLGALVDYLRARLGRPAHQAAPRADTAYTMEGPRTGRPLDLRYGNCFPAEGTCVCGTVIRQESADEPWKHTGRKPGEPG